MAAELPSHKRTSSTAQNTTTAPQAKRQAQTPSSQYVYIVMEEVEPQYQPKTAEIHGVYASLKDANNAAMKIASQYQGAEDCTRGIDADGRAHWHSGDAGEGTSISLTIQKELLHPSTSDPEMEWGDAEKQWKSSLENKELANGYQEAEEAES